MTLDAWSCLQGICGQIGQAGEMRFVHHGQSSNSSSFFLNKEVDCLHMPILLHIGGYPMTPLH